MTADNILSDLENRLARSTDADRKEWAKRIAENHTNLRDLCQHLLKSKYEIASRFLWLLTDIGTLAPELLHAQLPFILDLYRKRALQQLDMPASLANYWKTTGVPEENEGEAIELLFTWLQSPQTKVNTKARALSVLLVMYSKYPDLKVELLACLKDQLGKNTEAFDRKIHAALLVV